MMMKKLNFKIGDKNKLSKREMKAIAGGEIYCYVWGTGHSGCLVSSGVTALYVADYDHPCDAQYFMDEWCGNYETCCETVDCGC
jgi:natural product precursor